MSMGKIRGPTDPTRERSNTEFVFGSNSNLDPGSNLYRPDPRTWILTVENYEASPLERQYGIKEKIETLSRLSRHIPFPKIGHMCHDHTMPT